MEQWMFLIISILGLCTLIGIFIVFVSGGYLKKRYIEPWNRKHYMLFTDPRKQLIAHGILAPNGHNTQPWMFVLSEEDPYSFELWLDPKRLAFHVDPDLRQALISMGTLIKYMEVAGKSLGFPIHITWFPKSLMNHLDTQMLVKSPIAKITYHHEKPLSDPLYASLFKPDTNRFPYVNQKLPDSIIQWFKDQNSTEYQVKVIDNDNDVHKIKEYAMKAAIIETENDQVMQETDQLFRKNEREKNHFRYGFSLEGQGLKGFMMHIIQTLLTLFPKMGEGDGTKQVFLKNTKLALDHTSSFLIMSTSLLTPKSCVDVGMKYALAVLKLSSEGYALHPVSQTIEVYDTMQNMYRDIHDAYAEKNTILMLARLGKPTKQCHNTMRMDVPYVLKR